MKTCIISQNTTISTNRLTGRNMGVKPARAQMEMRNVLLLKVSENGLHETHTGAANVSHIVPPSSGYHLEE